MPGLLSEDGESWLNPPPSFEEATATPPTIDDPFLDHDPGTWDNTLTSDSTTLPSYSDDTTTTTPRPRGRLLTLEDILTPGIEFAKLTCADGHLWIRWHAWSVTRFQPWLDPPRIYESFLGALPRVTVEEALCLMQDKPYLLPKIVDRLNLRDYPRTAQTCHFDATMLRYLCELVEKLPEPGRPETLRTKFACTTTYAKVVVRWWVGGLRPRGLGALGGLEGEEV